MLNAKLNTLLFLVFLALTNTKISLKSSTQSNGQCKLGNGGIGLPGTCLSTLPQDISKLAFPNETAQQSKFLTDIIENNTSLPFNSCFGDFTVPTINTKQPLKEMRCNTIPLDKNYKYGIFSGKVKNVMCGSKTYDLESCLAFDRCGFLALAINGEVLSCLASINSAVTSSIGAALGSGSKAVGAASAANGVAALLEYFAAQVDYLTFGFSYKRKYVCENFEVGYSSGNDYKTVSTKTISTRAHIFLGNGFNLPLRDIKIGRFSLDDLLDITPRVELFADYGDENDIKSSVSNIIDSITSTSTTKKTAPEVMNKILNDVKAEYTIRLSGEVTFKLKKYSFGFIPDFTINPPKQYMLITNNSKAKLPTGIYLTIEHNANLIYDAIFDHMKSVLNTVDIFKPKLPYGKLKMLMYITPSSIGFAFRMQNLAELKCIYKGKNGNLLSEGEISCGVSGKFFTAINKSNNWVVKKARRLFDQSGKDVMKFGNDKDGFSFNANSANASQKLINLAKASNVKKVSKNTKKNVKKTARNVRKKGRSIINKVRRNFIY